MPSGRNEQPGRRQRVLQLREQGLSLRQIARQVGLTYTGVSYLLRRPSRTVTGPIACGACGRTIREDWPGLPAGRPVLCLDCLAKRPGSPFAQRLVAFRVAAGLTVPELARRSHVRAGMLNAYEKGT